MNSSSPLRLFPLDETPGHPWASPSHYDGDINVLAYLLLDVRSLLHQIMNGAFALAEESPVQWSVHGLRRRTIVLDLERALAHETVHVVGFLGNRRPDAEDSGIETVEADLVNELASHPGLVTYSSMELIGEQWANLVVHNAPDVREQWRRSDRHKHAVDFVSPRAYSGVRIHNGHITGGLVGPNPIVIERTKYWDFDVEPTWHAVRELPGGVYQRAAVPDEIPEIAS